ncbi:orotidine-5'-phosphate decarboxylase [Candidatus Amarobacter glycogenicus]|uniref:orotidine-5'-phosphate decarboxylase n=1 Tax=Candidatus Amarobacter glycogenicus TaxID=3140699 RepID=UPI003135AE36|nr:orotidine-5'-phosphate decarboxylase [Dehalococcoidia bacterium]
MRFFERLEARSRAVDSLVCVGLDPDFRKHRVEDVAAFNTAIVEATAEFAACFKPNIAFYEQWGIPGLHALEQTLKAIPAGIPVICDAKRGDMGNTAEAYARALFESWGFDCATVNGYQGSDAIAPFLAYPEKAVFVLCRTSNPGAREFQEQRLENGRLLYQQVALTATSWSPNVGLVVGATAPAELADVRRLVPGTPLLVPGVGAQGGKPDDVVRAAGYVPGLMVVNASRSILYAGEGVGFADAAGAAARELRDELRAAAATSP